MNSSSVATSATSPRWLQPVQLPAQDGARRDGDRAAVGPAQVGDHQRRAGQPGNQPQRGQVRHHHHVAVAGVPARHRITGHGVHVDVDGKQIAAALGAVGGHLVDEEPARHPLAGQPALHVGERHDDGVDIAGRDQFVPGRPTTTSENQSVDRRRTLPPSMPQSDRYAGTPGATRCWCATRSRRPTARSILARCAAQAGPPSGSRHRRTAGCRGPTSRAAGELTSTVVAISTGGQSSSRITPSRSATRGCPRSMATRPTNRPSLVAASSQASSAAGAVADHHRPPDTQRVEDADHRLGGQPRVRADDDGPKRRGVQALAHRVVSGGRALLGAEYDDDDALLGTGLRPPGLETRRAWSSSRALPHVTANRPAYGPCFGGTHSPLYARTARAYAASSGRSPELLRQQHFDPMAIPATGTHTTTANH